LIRFYENQNNGNHTIDLIGPENIASSGSVIRLPSTAGTLATVEEDVWARSGTTISTKTSGDAISIDGNLTGTDTYINFTNDSSKLYLLENLPFIIEAHIVEGESNTGYINTYSDKAFQYWRCAVKATDQDVPTSTWYFGTGQYPDNIMALSPSILQE